jgi:hypothetical protein
MICYYEINMIYMLKNDIYVFPHSLKRKEKRKKEEEDMLITVCEIQFTLYHIYHNTHTYCFVLPKTIAELIEWLREAERYCAR